MKEYWQYIKAFFAIKKLFKKGNIMSIESIQKMYVLLGGLLVGLNASWIPQLVLDAVSPEATQIIFTAIGAVVAVFQWFKSRTGKGKPQELRTEKNVDSASLAYIFWPFKKA